MTQKSIDYIEDLLDMSDPPDTNCSSEIAEYYAGRNVLITGSSGFFGILLIERLLRCCPLIGKIYVLMKEKKEKSPEERFKEHFNCVVYDRLKQEQPDFITKVIMVEADMSKENLGLSPGNQKRLLDTNVIFHMAATVRFNESIRNAVNINVRGTKELLLLAREMPNMQAFVHVSTAYSYCVNMFIEEKHYIPPLITDKILKLMEILDDETLNKITPTLVGKWPNTYVYTKAIAEDTVRQYSVGYPACIIRPSIVASTLKEPVPGWVNNIYGVVGVVAGCGYGFLRTLHIIPEYSAEIMPADYVVANIIAVGWDLAQRKDTLLSIDSANLDVSETERMPIYNCVSSAQNPISWKKFMYYNEKYGFEVPSIKCIWYYSLTMNRHRFIHKIYVIFLHTIPAVVCDILARLVGRQPILVKSYKKINTFCDVLSYFTTRQWQFRNDSVVKLWDKLNPVDRELFDFNIQDLNWEDYLKKMIPGLRLYIIHDTIDTVPQGKAKFRKLKIAHYTLLYSSFILLAWAIVSLVNFVISFFL